jgi:hypothetical protein
MNEENLKSQIFWKILRHIFEALSRFYPQKEMRKHE